jgi:hypothetical protein
VHENRNEKANPVVPNEGKEEEQKRQWSERKLGGSVHGGAGGNRAIEPYLCEHGVADDCLEERRRWQSTMRRQSDGGGLLSSERGGGGEDVRWRAALPLGCSGGRRKGASERANGIEAERGAVL